MLTGHLALLDSGHLAGATLDVFPAPPGENGERPAPGTIWPVLYDIEADLLFERASMTITAQRARAFNARVDQAVARIEHLGHDPILQVRGQASGPLADMVRYVNESPVKRWTGGVTDGADTQGPAKLDLNLQIPLQHATETKVTGAVVLTGNTITLAGIPSFTRTTGTLNFNERGVRINNLATNLLGPANLTWCVARQMIDVPPAAGMPVGRVVNVGSRGAYRGEPDIPAYGASKAGLHAFGQSMAQRLAPRPQYARRRFADVKSGRIAYFEQGRGPAALFVSAQMARKYKLPFRSGGGLTSSKVADGQAMWEATMTFWPSTPLSFCAITRPITSVAIICPPLGNLASSGRASSGSGQADRNRARCGGGSLGTGSRVHDPRRPGGLRGIHRGV